MNESDVKKPDQATNEARANRARQRLSEDLRDMTQVGQAMIKKTGRIGTGALIGLGAIGLILLTASMFRKKPIRNPLERYVRPREPSFLRQATRTIVLSALGVLATRVAQRLPLPDVGLREGLPAE
ncbi:MAG TPA: hypothetical protein VGP93_07525 [Polyangiaceae bacterium]|jgi:hypothetical protein|nr:hypothetical protein [Polyangiaceae bacterium]